MDEVDKNKYIKRVVIIGLSEEQKETIPSKYLDKVVCISDNDFIQLNKEDIYRFIDDKYPVYISIDKDVLSEDVVKTSWDQGKMNFDLLKRILHSIILKFDIIGIDVCGETEPNNIESIRNNDRSIHHYSKLFIMRIKSIRFILICVIVSFSDIIKAIENYDINYRQEL